MSERRSQLRDRLRALRSQPGFLESVWFAVIFAAPGYFKYLHAANKAYFEIDGGYYADVARHVRDGLGLTTNISLYHQAYSYFPHETSVSPGWPLLYGYASRFADIFTVGVWLPTMLYVCALFTGFFWARRLFPGDLFPTRLPGFTAGHVFVLMLALHREFFIFTSVPYTEGLTYAIVGLCLWRFMKLWPRLDLWRGLEMGVWLGLIMLARAQLVLVAIATFMTITWAVVACSSRRRQHLQALGSTALMFVAIIGGYYLLFLKGFVGNGPIAALMRFDQGWETPVLSAFDPMVKTDGLWSFIKDRMGGVWVAFKYYGGYSYSRNFYYTPYAVPLATLFLAVGAARNRARWRAAWSWLRSAEALPWIMVVLFALGGFTSMHLIHKDYFSEWHFARRQGLTAIFIFFLALIYLLKQKNLGVILGLIILIASVSEGHYALYRVTLRVEKINERGAPDHRAPLLEWLNEQGKVTVAMAAHEPQKIAIMTPEVGYHWVYEKTSFEDLDIITTKLGARFVILTDNAKVSRWPLRKDRRFSGTYRKMMSVGGMTVYERK